MIKAVLEHLGGSIELSEGETIVGRGLSCAIRFNDLAISRQHVAITVTASEVTVRDLGSSSLAQLVASEPGVLAAVPCAEGDLTPPRRTIDGLVVYGVAERIDPQERPFDQAREMVVQSLLRDQGRELQEEFSLLILRQNGFELFSERVRDPKLFPALT